MNKTVNRETRNNKIVKLINNGATWQLLEEKFGITRVYMQKCLREHYKTEIGYNKILAKARSNDKSEREERYIYIIETGAYINKPSILNKKKQVFSVDFCKAELKKISEEKGINVSKILNNPKICWVHVGVGRLNVMPKERIRSRTLGIVGLCCTMAKRNKGKTIKLYTNSREVASVVAIQGIDVEVVMC